MTALFQSLQNTDLRDSMDEDYLLVPKHQQEDSLNDCKSVIFLEFLTTTPSFAIGKISDVLSQIGKMNCSKVFH